MPSKKRADYVRELSKLVQANPTQAQLDEFVGHLMIEAFMKGVSYTSGIKPLVVIAAKRRSK